jgi:hypothetical protein
MRVAWKVFYQAANPACTLQSKPIHALRANGIHLIEESASSFKKAYGLRPSCFLRVASFSAGHNMGSEQELQIGLLALDGNGLGAVSGSLTESTNPKEPPTQGARHLYRRTSGTSFDPP